jgi:hypothetical protein
VLCTAMLILMTKMKNYVLFFLGALILSHSLYAQKDSTKVKKKFIFFHPDLFYAKFLPNLDTTAKPIIIDTNYIRTYKEKLNISLRVFKPTIAVDFVPSSETAGASESSSMWRTNVSHIIGFVGSYRFVSAGFAVQLNNNKSQTDFARSSYRTATIRYNSTKFYFQFKYLRIRGYTDVNRNNDPYGNNQYTQREDIVTKEFQFEGMYNFRWKKYSYHAPSSFTERQLKSNWGPLLKGGFFYNQIKGDSDIVSAKQQAYFGNFNDVHQLRGMTLKIAPGIGATLVLLKNFYFSGACFVAYDIYHYTYFKSEMDKKSSGNSLLLSFDTKLCAGYHSDRFYFGARYEFDSRTGQLDNVTKYTSNHYIGIDIGYRCNAPKLLKKIYKATMPPGM